ncbi:MAG: hypothetical protein M1831_001182 [Alyxoria varia]|nr:MAG: hypothetical protein M1831_001182 [Alyxoria varia]
MYLKHLHLLSALLATITITPTARAYQPYPFNPYDADYISRLRPRLSSFHERLSRGDVPSNNTSPSTHWNYDGQLLISRPEWHKALSTNINTSFKGLHIPDVYQLVDGNLCAVMYDLQGNQTGPFLGQPLREGARFKVHGAEFMVFDRDLLLEDLITVEPLGKIKAQFAGTEKVDPPTPEGARPVRAGTTSEEFLRRSRRNMASLHENVRKGRAGDNAELAVQDVVVDADGDVKRGREAFVDVVAARDQGLGAFPEKMVHDEYVLADGRLGAVEYIWHGRQRGEYLGMEASGKMVRVRSVLFFEFDGEGLVVKVVSVHDEGVIGTQLRGEGGYLYP